MIEEVNDSSARHDANFQNFAMILGLDLGQNDSPNTTSVSASDDSVIDPAIATFQHYGASINDYEQLEEVGRGGMGIVYRARQKSLGREIAIKFLMENGPTTIAAKRFLLEAAITAKLQHPGIPVVHEVGRLPNGCPFLAMKLIKGQTLAQLLDEPEGKPVTWLSLFENICQAVGYAHSQGVIHRDLKPANIMVGAFGEVQVADWGLAKEIGKQSEKQLTDGPASEVQIVGSTIPDTSDFLTQEGSHLGTPAYMAPEQARGNGDTVRVDVFGLGGILCAILTGQPVFIGSNSEATRLLAATAMLEPAFDRLDHCGAEPELIALCKRCLAPKPADRPDDGGAVAKEIAGLRASADERARLAEVESAKLATRKAADERQKARDAKHNRMRMILLGAFGVAVAVGVWRIQQANIENVNIRRQADIETLNIKQQAEIDNLKVRQQEEIKTLNAETSQLLTVADPKAFKAAFAKIESRPDLSVPVLQDVLVEKLIPESTDQDKERLAKRQAIAGVALLRLHQPKDIWSMLTFSDDPRRRSYLIHYLAAYGADPELIIEQIRKSGEDARFLQALILSLGEYDRTALPYRERKELAAYLNQKCLNHPDPGLHAAVEWLITSWRRAADPQDASAFPFKNEKESAPLIGSTPTWYTSKMHHKMIVIPGPQTFVMGSSPEEAGRFQDERKQHSRKIDRTFAVASKAVTLDQFRKYTAENNIAYKIQTKYSTNTSQDPAINVTWHQAAAYCNWLSEMEAIPKDQWCYEIDSNRIVTTMKDNYLSLTGYRLPSEAEMEFITRGGTKTSRCYGETSELLEMYAWYDKNSGATTHPVGQKKPNEYGFFDVHGNVMNWCNTIYRDDYVIGSGTVLDVEEQLKVTGKDRYVLRAGHQMDQASRVRSAFRFSDFPDNQDAQRSFRPARTLTP